jgi:hypothetical protein
MAADKTVNLSNVKSALQSKWAEEYFIVCMMSVVVHLGFNESGS